MSKKRVILSIGLLFIVAFVFIFFNEQKKIKSWKVNAWERAQRADCGVVLTGDNGRTQEGMDLLYKKYIKKLIISGVNPESELIEIFPQWFLYGLSKDDVFLEKYSKTTYGNAIQSLSLVEALGCRDIVLVTSHFHMYRTMRIFKAIFPEQIIIYPRAVVSEELKTPRDKLYLETVKSLFYSLWAY